MMTEDPVSRVVSLACESFATVNGFVNDRIGKPRPIQALDCVDAFARRRHKVRRLQPPQLRQIGTAVEKNLRPADCKLEQTDWSKRERAVNVLTSVPYAIVGASMYRRCNKPWTKAYAASQVGVGVIAALYHASHGPIRKWSRRADYWAISAASATMTKAVHPESSNAWMLASAAATPFVPFATSAANTAVMEIEYLKQACRNKELRPAYKMHLATGGAGLALFAADEVKPFMPLVHAAWHVLSCVSVHYTLPLLEAKCQPRQVSQGV
eukprot:jgi/Ulvmu1/8866/UM049_0048.1